MIGEAGLVVGVLCAAAGAFWFVLKMSSDKIVAQYRALSKRFGLELEQHPAKLAGFLRPEPSVYGTYRDREVSVSAPGKGVKGTRQIETVVKVELKDRRLQARIGLRGLLSGPGKRELGDQVRWNSKDEIFDQTVDLRTNQTTVFDATMDEARRKWLLDHLKHSKATLYLGNGTMAYAKLGLIANEATRLKFEEVIEFLCDFAESVES